MPMMGMGGPTIIISNIPKLISIGLMLLLLPSVLFGIVLLFKAFLDLVWTLTLGFTKLNIWFLFTGNTGGLNGDSFTINFHSPTGKLYIILIAAILFALICAIIYEVIKKVFAWSFLSNDEYLIRPVSKLYNGRDQQSISPFKNWLRWIAFTLGAVIFIPLLILVVFTIFNLAISYVLVPIFGNIFQTQSFGASVKDSRSAMILLNVNISNLQNSLNILKQEIQIENVPGTISIASLLDQIEKQLQAAPEKAADLEAFNVWRSKLDIVFGELNNFLNDAKGQVDEYTTCLDYVWEFDPSTLFAKLKNIDEKLITISYLITGKISEIPSPTNLPSAIIQLIVATNTPLDRRIITEALEAFSKSGSQTQESLIILAKAFFGNDCFAAGGNLTMTVEGLGLILKPGEPDEKIITTTQKGLDLLIISSLTAPAKKFHTFFDGVITQSTLNLWKQTVLASPAEVAKTLKSGLMQFMLANNNNTLNTINNSITSYWVTSYSPELALIESMNIPLFEKGIFSSVLDSKPGSVTIDSFNTADIFNQHQFVLENTPKTISTFVTKDNFISTIVFPMSNVVDGIIGTNAGARFSIDALPSLIIALGMLIMSLKYVLKYAFYLIWRCFNIIFDFILMVATGILFAWNSLDEKYGPQKFYDYIRNIFSHVTMMVVTLCGLYVLTAFLNIIIAPNFAEGFTTDIFGNSIFLPNTQVTFDSSSNTPILTISDIISSSFQWGRIAYVTIVLGSVGALFHLINKFDIFFTEKFRIPQDEQPQQIGKQISDTIESALNSSMMVVGIGAAGTMIFTQAISRGLTYGAESLSKHRQKSNEAKASAAAARGDTSAQEKFAARAQKWNITANDFHTGNAKNKALLLQSKAKLGAGLVEGAKSLGLMGTISGATFLAKKAQKTVLNDEEKNKKYKAAEAFAKKKGVPTKDVLRLCRTMGSEDPSEALKNLYNNDPTINPGYNSEQQQKLRTFFASNDQAAEFRSLEGQIKESKGGKINASISTKGFENNEVMSSSLDSLSSIARATGGQAQVKIDDKLIDINNRARDFAEAQAKTAIQQKIEELKSNTSPDKHKIKALEELYSSSKEDFHENWDTYNSQQQEKRNILITPPGFDLPELNNDSSLEELKSTFTYFNDEKQIKEDCLASNISLDNPEFAEFMNEYKNNKDLFRFTITTNDQPLKNIENDEGEIIMSASETIEEMCDQAKKQRKHHYKNSKENYIVSGSKNSFDYLVTNSPDDWK